MELTAEKLNLLLVCVVLLVASKISAVLAANPRLGSRKDLGQLEFCSASVPFQVVRNNIFVDTELGHKTAAEFLVDTGCTMSAIDEAAVKRLNLRVITQRKQNGSVIRVVRIPMRLGSIHLQDVPLRVRNLSRLQMPADTKPIGIIGENILKQFRVTFDFGHRLIVINGAKSRASIMLGGAISVRHADDGSGILFDASIDDSLKIPCLFDTGASVSLVPDKLVEPLLNKPIIANGEIGGLSGERVKTAEVTFHSFRAGNFEKRNPVLYVKLLKAAGRKACNPGCVLENDTFATVGPAFWGKSVVTIDYPHMKIQIENGAD